MTAPALDLPDFDGPALCAEVDPELFFPEGGGSPRQAKKVCAACTITDQCLIWALARDEKFGVWGGLTERERRRLRGRKPRHQAASCGTKGGHAGHIRRGEEPCGACVEGRRTYNREYQYRTGRRTPQDGAA